LHLNHRRSVVAALSATLIFAAALAGCEQESSATLLSRARQYQQKSEFAAAVIILKNGVSANPDDGEMRYLLATVYLDTGDALSAEKEIRMAIKLAYSSEMALPVLGRTLLLQGQFQQVIDETEPAAANNGAELLCIRGDAFLAMGKRDDANHLYAKVLQSKPTFAAALIGRGRVAYLEGDIDAARKYAELARGAAPRSTDALLFKGDLLRAQNQPEQALATYDQVLAINPAHRSAHVEKAYLEISLGKFVAAQADLDAARTITPASVLVAYTQTLLDFSQGKYADAQESMQKVLRVAPEHMPSVLLAGAINLSLGSLYQAEHHLRHYLEKNPDNLYARKMLASTLLRSGHAPGALDALAPALKQSQQDVQLLALAGESYMQARDFNRAAEFFDKAAVLEPKAANLRTSLALSKLGKGDPIQAVSDLHLATRLDAKSQKAGIALVRTELGLRHVENAFAAVLALEQAQPDNAAVQDLKGVVYIGKQDAVQARAHFTKALLLQPSYFPAVANLVQLDLREKNPQAAKQHLTNFLANNPSSVEAMTALASLAAGDAKQEEATQWLQQASLVDPNAIEPAVNLMAQYLQAGKNQKALDLARKLQVTHPDNPDLLDLLGKSELANGEQENALATYKKLALALPRSAQAQMQMAALELLLKNTTAAEDYLKTALAMQPDFPAAQLALAELYVRKGSHELALMYAGRLQQKYPRAAAGFQLEGDVLMGQNKAAQALPMFEQALALSKTSELAIKSINALRVTGRQVEATKRLAHWSQLHPNDIRLQLYKAETLLADKQYKAAAAQLELTVKQQPNNIVALNNLALAYQQLQDVRAQQVAERAYTLANDQPVIMDTLGWILIERGDTARGLAILRKASAQAPQARDIRYHVAMGLYKTGDKAAARKELELLASGNMRFAQADEVRALLKQVQ
jgi:putative PEP-CTERM system TPR-repeat lipoprotein